MHDVFETTLSFKWIGRRKSFAWNYGCNFSRLMCCYQHNGVVHDHQRHGRPEYHDRQAGRLHLINICIYIYGIIFRQQPTLPGAQQVLMGYIRHISKWHYMYFILIVNILRAIVPSFNAFRSFLLLYNIIYYVSTVRCILGFHHMKARRPYHTRRILTRRRCTRWGYARMGFTL